jgi:hypothetical protein
VRNDLITYENPGLKEDGYFIGAEFFAQLVWSPFSDLQFNLGGGVFVPSMGDAWVKNEKPQWKIEINAVLAIF